MNTGESFRKKSEKYILVSSFICHSEPCHPTVGDYQFDRRKMTNFPYKKN